jgi:hypothetical protein
MVALTAAMIKQLRSETGASMMDCKPARSRRLLVQSGLSRLKATFSWGL